MPKVAEILGNYVAFDFEWDPVTHVLEAASFVDSHGKSKVLLRSDFEIARRIRLLKHSSAKLIDYDLSMGWNSTGHMNNAESAKKSDLSILHERCIANEVKSVVSLGSKGVPYIERPKAYRPLQCLQQGDGSRYHLQ